MAVRKLISLKYCCGSLIPVLDIVWFEDIRETGLLLSREALRLASSIGNIDEIEDLLSKVLNVMTMFQLGGSKYPKVDRPANIITYLRFIAESLVYPFSFIPSFYQYVRGEEAEAQSIALIHRIHKIPASSLGSEAQKLESAISFCIPCGDDIARLALALGIAGYCIATTRKSFEILVTLAQTLMALLSLTDKNKKATRILIKELVAYLLAYLYTIYPHKCAGVEEAELLRHLLPRVPAWVSISNAYRAYTRLGEELSRLQCLDKVANELGELVGKSSIGLNEIEKLKHEIMECVNNIRKTIGSVIEEVEGRKPERINELLLGRIGYILDTYIGVVKGRAAKPYDACVTVCTGQWGLLQTLMLSSLGCREVYALYTQEVLYNVILERVLRGQFGNKVGIEKKKFKYIVASATDMLYTTVLIEKLLNKLSSKNVLVIAQGPATIAVPLYKAAKNKGFCTVLV